MNLAIDVNFPLLECFSTHLSILGISKDLQMTVIISFINVKAFLENKTLLVIVVFRWVAGEIDF